jgi:uncharacterized repeat protein (TIGR01451 family)
MRRIKFVTAIGLVLALAGACVPQTPPGPGPAEAPGTGGEPNPVNFGSILPIVNETGQVTLAVDGVGTTAATGTLEIAKPAGATVRSAFMAAASTGFSERALADGDVTIDGAGVTWDIDTPSAIGSNNHWADVTSLVKPKLDAAAAGNVSFTIGETDSGGIDGELLAVIFDDPAAPVQTVALLFGAQDVLGDTFNIGFAEPIDTSVPNFTLELGLGISFGFQPGQDSLVDVNGTRLTSSAGGSDDGETFDGALFTVGGLGDSSANPSDPNAPSVDARTDDERYDLRPFVDDGDTSIEVFTQNPSTDDNILFASLVLSSAAVVGEGIVLAPITDDVPVGGTHTVTATVQNDEGAPVAGRSVTFEVVSGPNDGVTGTATTNASGEATFSYSSATAGVDIVEARMVDSGGDPRVSNQVRVEWTGESEGFDVTVEATAQPADVAPGGTVLYRSIVRNNGPDTAPAVAMADVIPNGTTFQSATTTQGGCSGVDADRRLVCLIGTLAAGASATIDVQVTAPTTVGARLVNTSTVITVPADTNTANNTVTAIATVQPEGPGEDVATGFVVPGGTITTGVAATPEDPTVSGLTLPNTGSGANITLIEREGGRFCGGPCGPGQFTILRRFLGYEDFDNPPVLRIRYDASLGLQLSGNLWMKKQGVASIVPFCSKKRVSPCLLSKRIIDAKSAKVPDDVGDLEVRILVLGPDPRFRFR